MSHHHCHHDTQTMGDRRLVLAVAVNVGLTAVQVLGGLMSGSLSLVADALHNLSDAASLAIALVARKIGRKPADAHKTFGYKRAENIAALINLVSLVIIGLFLVGQALKRFFAPEPIAGWLVIGVAAVALLVDLVTAWLTFRMAQHSSNIKAAFLHNITDALASVAVIVSGSLILLYGWVWTDAALTLLIAGYVLWHAGAMLPQTIHLLMEGTPEGLDRQEVIKAMEATPGVENVHHVHIWQLDEHRIALEAHVVVTSPDLPALENLKGDLKSLLSAQFEIQHSTLEFEYESRRCNK